MQLLQPIIFGLLLLAVGNPVFALPEYEDNDLISKVNLMIGVGGHGYGIGGLPVTSQVPYGMMRLGPDTSQNFEIWIPWQHTGGYYYGDSHIRTFSHTHTVGAGVVDYGTLGIFPGWTIPDKVGTGYADRFPWMLRFSHDTETAEPGYYSASLTPNDPLGIPNTIEAELTSTVNTGIHRYTWKPAGKHEDGLQHIVFLDTTYTLTWDGCTNSSTSVSLLSTGSDQEITGYLHDNGNLSERFGGINVYFSIWVNSTVESVGIWNDTGSFVPGETSVVGNRSGVYLVVPNNTTSVEVAVGISFVSVEKAKNNLLHDLNRVLRLSFNSSNSMFPVTGNVGWTVFDRVKQVAQVEWESKLSLVQLNEVDSSITSDNITVFYSAVYHSFLSPTQFSESDGVYLGFDDQPHRVPFPHQYYSDMSIWDTFRTDFPWLALMEREVMSDVCQSLVLMYEQGGDLPRWPMANGYTNTMDGQHADIVLADSLVHGLLFDVETAYEGMYQGATQPQENNGRTDLSDYLELGYVVYDDSDTSCVLTLEYSYDDWSISQVASYLNRSDEYSMFLSRGRNYQTQWNSTIQFMCPRYKSGESDCPSFLHWFGNDWVEGNAWQYRFYTPQDPVGLMSLFNSTDFFVSQLQSFMEDSFLIRGHWLPNPYYWGGNEPDLFSAFEFAFAERIDLTQQYVRRALSFLYPNAPDGLAGNDDYGTMSSWAIFAYLGIYPRSGDGLYVLSSPVFSNVTLKRKVSSTSTQPALWEKLLETKYPDLKENEKESIVDMEADINIIAYNASQTNCYVANCTFNGQVLLSPFLYASDLVLGGTVEFWMQDSPSSTFWTSYEVPAYS